MTSRIDMLLKQLAEQPERFFNGSFMNGDCGDTCFFAALTYPDQLVCTENGLRFVGKDEGFRFSAEIFGEFFGLDDGAAEAIVYGHDFLSVPAIDEEIFQQYNAQEMIDRIKEVVNASKSRAGSP